VPVFNIRALVMPVSNTVVCVEGTVVFSNVVLPVVTVKNASGALVHTARIITIQRGARQAHVQACSTASLAARASGASVPCRGVRDKHMRRRAVLHRSRRGPVVLQYLYRHGLFPWPMLRHHARSWGAV